MTFPIGTVWIILFCPCQKSVPLRLPQSKTKCQAARMIHRLVEALRTRKRAFEVRFALVVDPATVDEAQGVRHRMILGGKVIDLIRKPKPSTGGHKNELDVE